ncbi:hypothetical protein N0V85_001825 [Neurospora sp. IMI 360204]|nr:hypothetical protein N0V85_001825 [Neurospora sp. IMI 360204]
MFERELTRYDDAPNLLSKLEAFDRKLSTTDQPSHDAQTIPPSGLDIESFELVQRQRQRLSELEDEFEATVLEAASGNRRA